MQARADQHKHELTQWENDNERNLQKIDYLTKQKHSLERDLETAALQHKQDLQRLSKQTQDEETHLQSQNDLLRLELQQKQRENEDLAQSLEL